MAQSTQRIKSQHTLRQSDIKTHVYFYYVKMKINSLQCHHYNEVKALTDSWIFMSLYLTHEDQVHISPCRVSVYDISMFWMM